MVASGRDIPEIRERLSSLEKSLAKLESRLDRLERSKEGALQSGEVSPGDESAAIHQAPADTTQSGATFSLEQQIGEYWLGQFGIIILIIGLIFLISYTSLTFGPFWQAFAGFAITVSVYIASRLFSRKFELLGKVLLPGSLFLLYFVTLRLHFFTPQPLIPWKTLSLFLLVGVIAVQSVVALRHNSQWMTALPVLLGFLTALLSDTHHFALALIVASALFSAVLLSVKHWQVLGIGSIVLSYLSFLLYLLNNPLLGKEIHLLPEHGWMLGYLLITLVIYTMVSFRPHVNDYLTRFTRIALTTANSSGFYLVSLLITFHFFRPHLAFWNFVFAGVLFSIAIAHWTVRQSKYSTSFYASFSYVALTVGLLAATNPPHLFLWLVWQSALVVGTAIWFRSGIIVWANMGIFLLVLFSYLFISEPHGAINLHFTIVAFLSERLLYYGRNRIRNLPLLFQRIYLLAGYGLLIFGLSLLLPTAYVSIAWFLVSALFLAAGYLRDMPFYRTVGFLSILIPVSRLFIIDLASLEPIYRVISFLIVGNGLIAVAIFYSRRP